jgi:hypothetical protein
MSLSKSLTIFVGVVLLWAVPLPARSANYGCSLKGFDQTPPPAMLSPKANVQSFDWGSDVDTIQGNRGWLFWHYIRNRAGNKPLWVTWNAAGLGTSGAMALPGGGTVCKQSQVFFQLNQPPDTKIMVDNDAPILYGARGEQQDASIYRPVPPIVAQEPTGGPFHIWSFLTHLVSVYEDHAGVKSRIDVTVSSSHTDAGYVLRVAAAPENLVIGISQLSDLLNSDQLANIVQAFRKQGSTVEPGSLPPTIAAALFRPSVPKGQHYLFVSRTKEAVGTYAAARSQTTSLNPALLVVLDNDRRPILAAGIALVVPSKRQ